MVPSENNLTTIYSYISNIFPGFSHYKYVLLVLSLCIDPLLCLQNFAEQLSNSPKWPLHWQAKDAAAQWMGVDEGNFVCDSERN